MSALRLKNTSESDPRTTASTPLQGSLLFLFFNHIALIWSLSYTHHLCIILLDYLDVMFS